MEDRFMNDQKDNSKKIFTIPNIISVFRLILIPVIVWAYVFKRDDLLTVVLLVVSSLSDIVDGFIARHFNMTSDLGKILDPVADKFTQFAMILCLLFRFNHMIVPFILLAVKEITDVIMGIIAINASNEVKGAEWHGKAATSSIFVMMAVHLLWKPVFNSDIPYGVSAALAAVASVFIILSLILYTKRNIEMIKSGRNK